MDKNVKIYLDTCTLHAGIYAEIRIIPGKGFTDVSKYAEIRGKKMYEEIKLLPDIIVTRKLAF